ncbi:zinc-binding alcohol dehydrogenase family protein [Rhizobium rosettiformans]|uniref:Zinc-type alcohol dehydrogenase-like protein n=1 Tax=Rhizobium rosettiformans TaxID=1368430 RepID=A0ABX7EWL2_9HYPH|nr:zinc-binding alcohol dehydrogenase family protein [Rhizobium rosettiformans]QRF52447.1 zinc-binding alcohol dehydrogenase family protein [Rhizobium rosettiformans]
MRAIGFHTPQPITSETALVDLEQPVPEAAGHDLLVEIKAVSVNPVDTKVRRNQTPPAGEARILGYDAAGVVKAVGPDVSLFKPGDEVYYAGAINRPGTNAEYHLVDERIVGLKPKTLSFAQAAALPLTAITAYEALFDRLKVSDPVLGAGRSILITGGAGGVGSIAIQLAKELTDLTVIATASRPETADWAKSLGADHVIDHSKPLAQEFVSLGIDPPGLIFSVTHSGQHRLAMAEIIAPMGRICLIDDFPEGFDILAFKQKVVSLHWEFMFSRPVFQTPDMIEQHKLLTHVAELIDAGKIRTTLDTVLGPITAENLREAHRLIESNRTRGKIVLEGFPA